MIHYVIPALLLCVLVYLAMLVYTDSDNFDELAERLF